MNQTDTTLEGFLAKFTPEMQDISMRTRQLVFDVLPDAVERVYPGWGAIWYGRSAKMGEQLFAISPGAKYMNLAFSQGAHLPDPKGLLEGTGKNMRHVKIRQVQDTEEPALKALMQAAVE